MLIKSTAGSHLVDGIWVTPDGPPTEIHDADWPKYSTLPGVVQVATEATASAPTLESLEAELQVETAKIQALEAAATPTEIHT